MSPNDASGKLNKLLTCTMVHVYVGDGLKDFAVHKDLICHYSPFFKAAFTSGFEETTTGIVKLRETELQVFELFYHWLYTQDLYLPLWEPSKSSTAVDETIVLDSNHSDCKFCGTDTHIELRCDYDSDCESSFEPPLAHDDNCALGLFYSKREKLLSMLYVFADMTRIPTLQNHCMESFYATTGLSARIPIELMGYIWDNTIESSRLRKIMIDMMVWEYPHSGYILGNDAIPAGVKDEVLHTMRRRFSAAVFDKRGALVNPLRNMTNYHVKVDERAQGKTT